MACLEVALELNQKVKNEVVKRMEQIVPPKNFTEAKQLANAGDLAVPLLKYSRRTSRMCAACVRALALIGTETAVEALKDYAKNDTVLVVQELIKAAEIIDADLKYVETVLWGWTRLNIRGMRPVPAAIGQLKNLQRLIVQCYELRWLPESIRQLKNLESLCLCCPQLTSVPASISQLQNLRTVRASMRKEQLARLKKLLPHCKIRPWL